MIQPRNANSYQAHVGGYPFWAGDNGAFTKRAKGFDPVKFVRMLRLSELRKNARTCRFVVAPDRLQVLPSGQVIGDARGTLAQFPAWSEVIRLAGFPVALVAQNGLEDLLGEVPWGQVDVLFIGGDTRWKLSEAARVCIVEAKRRGKPAHMGRVNSYRRLARAGSMLCDTADGTFLKFAPERNLPRLLRWLDAINCGVQAHLPWGLA